MKQIISTILLTLGTSSLFANNGFTEWMSGQKYGEVFKEQSNSNYPIVVEAKTELNNKVAYRAYFCQFPSENFEFYSHHGISTKDYLSNHQKYTRKKFTLIYHQELVTKDNRTIHQATWVKSK